MANLHPIFSAYVPGGLRDAVPPDCAMLWADRAIISRSTDVFDSLLSHWPRDRQFNDATVALADQYARAFAVDIRVALILATTAHLTGGHA